MSTDTKTEEMINVVLFMDLGTINTRAALFERKDGRYGYVGAVTSPTLYSDTGRIEYQSVIGAVRKLENAAARHLLDDNDRIVVPRKLDMIGADQVVLTCSGGESPRIVLMGLTESGSLKALQDLLRQHGMTEAAAVCAMDGSSLTESVNTVLEADPDLVLVGGGTEAGAERAVYRLGEILLLSCKSIAEESRPVMIYMGNTAGRDQFEQVFGRFSDIRFAQNILEPKGTPNTSVGKMFRQSMTDFIRKSAPAAAVISEIPGSSVLPADFAYGRAIRLLSRMSRRNRTVLGIDVGASHTLTALGDNLDLDMCSSPLGIGNSLSNLADQCDMSELISFVGFQLKENEIRNYLYNKCLHPELIPANSYAAEIEQVLARFIIRFALKEHADLSPLTDGTLGTVLLGGSVIRNVSDPGEALRIGMDSVHPLGMVDYYMDMNGLASAVGAFTEVNRELASQVMGPSLFLNLGKVITPVSSVKDGRRIFSISLRDESGNVGKHDIFQGGIKRIPLQYGRYYELDFYNVNKGVVIPGVQTWTSIGFKSGCMGLVFDMRGEKLTPAKDRTAQIHLLERWKGEMGIWSSED